MNIIKPIKITDFENLKFVHMFYTSLKVLFLLVVITIIFAYNDYHTIMPQSFAVSDLSVTTQRDKYSIDDTLNISGSLYQASEDKMTLKIYNSDAKLIWTDTIPIGINDNKFNHSLILSGPIWTSTGIHVLLAQIDDSMVSAKFSLSLEKRVQQNQIPTTQEQQQTETIMHIINQTATIDIEQLAQQITSQILSSPEFSQKQQSSQQQELDVEQLAQQITSQILTKQSPPPPRFQVTQMS